jgi:hypothetical protein
LLVLIERAWRFEEQSVVILARKSVAVLDNGLLDTENVAKLRRTVEDIVEIER